MAKDPREQQKTDAERIGEHGTGKLDQDTDRMTEEDRRRRLAEDAERGAAERPQAQPPVE
jgi:hypothetical protein